MKTLLILRHAKSSWDDPEMADFDRPLNPRGRLAAPFMGKLMREKNLRVDLILSSPAQRARETALMVKESADFAAEIRYQEKIYEASPQTLVYLLAEMENEVDSALLVGHNPGLEGLIKILTGGIRSMPTAALAAISLKIESWNEISPNCGKLDFLIRPKDEMQ